jgi:hypothetical protein
LGLPANVVNVVCQRHALVVYPSVCAQTNALLLLLLAFQPALLLASHEFAAASAAHLRVYPQTNQLLLLLLLVQK